MRACGAPDCDDVGTQGGEADDGWCFIFAQLRFPQRLPGVLALGSCILLGSVIIVAFAEWIRRRGTPAPAAKWAPAG